MFKAINVLGLVRTKWPELRKTLVEEAMLEGGCHKTPRSACNRIIPLLLHSVPSSDKPLDQCAEKRHFTCCGPLSRLRTVTVGGKFFTSSAALSAKLFTAAAAAEEGFAPALLPRQ